MVKVNYWDFISNAPFLKHWPQFLVSYTIVKDGYLTSYLAISHNIRVNFLRFMILRNFIFTVDEIVWNRLKLQHIHSLVVLNKVTYIWGNNFQPYFPPPSLPALVFLCWLLNMSLWKTFRFWNNLSWKTWSNELFCNLMYSSCISLNHLILRT